MQGANPCRAHQFIMNKTKKPIIFLQEWGTYPFDTIIAIGGTIEDIENFFKIKKFKFKDDLREKLNKSLSSYAATFFDEKDHTTLVWFKRDSFKNMGIVAHEIFHLVNYVFSFIGISEEETFAYQMQYLINNILKAAKNDIK